MSNWEIQLLIFVSKSVKKMYFSFLENVQFVLAIIYEVTIKRYKLMKNNAEKIQVYK